MREVHANGKIWIVQRCVDLYHESYENWTGYSEEPMTCLEALKALEECKSKWPHYQFRLHFLEGAR